jgi:hypothetical protein
MGCLKLTYDYQEQGEKNDSLKWSVWVNPESDFLGVVDQQSHGNEPGDRGGNNYIGDVLGVGGWLSEATALSAYGTSMHGKPLYTGPKTWAGQVTRLNKIGKVAGNLGMGLTALSAGYSFATGTDNTSTLVDIGVTVIGAATIGIVGTAALPFVAAGGVIYGVWSLAGGSNWVDSNWGYRDTTKVPK